MNVQKTGRATLGYVKTNRFKLAAGLAACIAGAFGAMDAAAGATLMMIGDVEPTLKALEQNMKTAFEAMTSKVQQNQDVMQKALEDVRKEGTVYAKTADELKKVGDESKAATEEFKKKLNELATRVQDAEQKADKKPGGRAYDEIKTAGQAFTESPEYKEMAANAGANSGWNSRLVKMPREALAKTAIVNQVTLTNDQPLVAPQRLGGIIGPGLRRFTVRDLMPNLQTASNLIEFASELVFTSNAGPQYDSSSPDATRDGALKNESGLTFQLTNAPVITIAHYMPASRQILADAAMLRGYIDTRLIYGLKLEEEDELLNGANTAGKLNGLRNQMTSFTGGATNQTAIDTLLKAFTQISLSYFEASGVVLHPTDWMNILLLKDTQNRYLFSDPHGANSPSIWGKTVVPTQAIASGNFLAGAFDLAAAIYDREDVTIRVAEQHSDWFARNLVAILCEERLALALYRPTAIVGGSITTPG